MARVKGRDTRPEKIARSLLHGMAFRFRIHGKDLPGRPDIVLPRYRKIIFVNGCFWHGHEACKRSGRPKTNQAFWNRKIDATITRDARNKAALEAAGWNVMVVWECQTRDQENLQRVLADFMKQP